MLIPFLFLFSDKQVYQTGDILCKSEFCRKKIRLSNGKPDLVCRKSLAEFAPAGANKVLTIFSGDMCVGENTFRLANVRAQRVRCGEPQPFQTRAQRSGSRLRACQKYFLTSSAVRPFRRTARPCKRLEGRFPLYTLKSFLPLSLKNTRSDTIEVRVRIVE